MPQITHIESSNTARRTCESLGVCRGHIPACPGCKWAQPSARQHAFAPGVITTHTSQRVEMLRSWGRTARAALLLAVVLVSLSMATGYLVGTFVSGV